MTTVFSIWFSNLHLRQHQYYLRIPLTIYILFEI